MRRSNAPNLEQVLADLYASEINFQISSFWDCGYSVALGDEMNGFKARGHVDVLTDAGQWFIDNAVMWFPGSRFAELYRESATPGRTAVIESEPQFVIPATPEARERGCTCPGYQPELDEAAIDAACPLHGLGKETSAPAAH